MIRFIQQKWRILFTAALTAVCCAAFFLYEPTLFPAAFYEAQAYTAPVFAPDDGNTMELTTGPPPSSEEIEGQVTLLADNVPVLTLFTQEDAVLLVEELLFHAPLPAHGETVTRIAFSKYVALRPAALGETAIPLHEARSLLAASPQLCPVLVETVAATTESLPFAGESAEDARLPKDTRMVLTGGREGENMRIQTRRYISGVLSNEETVSIQTAAVQETTAVGSYISKDPGKEPGRKEGTQAEGAPDSFSLQAPVKGDISSNFGTRNGLMHYGLDYKCKSGDAVSAPAKGTVLFIGARGSYGHIIEIDHGNGFVTRLSPMQSIAVSVGETVEQGQQIAVLAPQEDDERADHLHMELIVDGIPYNPRYYIK